jgi:cytochrome P450
LTAPYITNFPAEYYSDFSSASAVEAFCGIAHRIASVILVGKKVSKEPAFKKASYSYFQGHGITGSLLLFLPLGPLRHYLAKPISYVQRVKQRRVLNIVATEFQDRVSGAGTRKVQVDGIEWTLKILKERPKGSDEPLPLSQMSHELVHLLGAAHTPVGMTITQMVWQVLAQPMYLHVLRKEAEEAVAKVGFTNRLVEYLPLQDSFIREANRLYPNNISEEFWRSGNEIPFANRCSVGTQRLVCGDPFVFHDGFTLPAGTRIAFPVGPYLRDADVFSRPDEFDGFRFVKLAEADARTEDGVNRWTAAHAHKLNLA